MSKYTAIFELKEKLEKASIPFEFFDRSFDTDLLGKWEHYQILYPNDKHRICSIIQGEGTYGHEKNLLEIMGLLTDEEASDCCVLGYLSVDEVFDRIAQHYENEH